MMLLKDAERPPGCVDVDTPLAKEFGFTSDKFDGYLWQEGDVVTISFIESLHPKQGNLKTLFDTIEAKGFHIVVPTPLGRMIGICQKRGMKPAVVNMDGSGVNCFIGAELFERAMRVKAAKKQESAKP